MKKTLTFIVGTLTLCTNVAVLALHLFSHPNDKKQHDDHSLIGLYRCHGIGPIFREPYHGILTITKPTFGGSTYTLSETFPKSYWEAIKGVGFKYGNTLIAIFNDRAYGSSITAYTIKRNNLKSGQFLYFNHSDKGFGQEDCIKMK